MKELTVLQKARRKVRRKTRTRVRIKTRIKSNKKVKRKRENLLIQALKEKEKECRANKMMRVIKSRRNHPNLAEAAELPTKIPRKNSDTTK